MIFKKKKQVVVAGLFCEAVDYHYYQISLIERITGYVLGFFVMFTIIYIMFSSMMLSLILGFIGIPLGLKFYQKSLYNKRERAMMIQFKEALQLLSNAYSTGYNMVDSFRVTQENLVSQFGEEAHMTQEFLIIVQGLYNGHTIEDLLRNLEQRSTLDDIRSFVDTFIVANRRGGDLKNLITDTKDIISQKIDETIEVQTTIHGSQSQVYILLVMPFVIILMMQGMGLSSGKLTAITFITKLIALFLFIIAYLFAKKVSKIDV